MCTAWTHHQDQRDVHSLCSSNEDSVREEESAFQDEKDVYSRVRATEAGYEREREIYHVSHLKAAAMARRIVLPSPACAFMMLCSDEHRTDSFLLSLFFFSFNSCAG